MADQTHETTRELRFIDGLGRWRDERCGYDVAALLRGYIESAKTRTDWARIDKDVVIDAAKQRIRRLEICARAG